MPPPRLPSRIPGAARLPRLPSNRHVLTHPPRRELVSPPLVRPQLPFLSPLTSNRPLPPLSIHLRQHFARLISTERRDYYKRRFGRGLRIGLSFYAILVLFQVIKLGMYQEEIEHHWPTPPEWTWKSRWCLRSAQALMHPEQIGKLMTNWPMVAGYLRELLERLEDPNSPDGKVMRDDADADTDTDSGGFLVEGVGRTGLDVSAKSEPWRRGYFQALMCAAKAAENLDGWWTDRTQRISAPVDYVVGPSNPRPKPMPAGQKNAPREEHCEPASPPPEVFYLRILTTRGFDSRQKLDAALAYADWLDYKGLQATARDMYTWAMDIAVGGYGGGDAARLVDAKTGVLKPTTITTTAKNNGSANTLPSENILRVSTALAVHHARHGNLPTALSIFTSVLQARRALPAAPANSFPHHAPSFPRPADPLRGFFTSLKNMFVPVEYPAPQPSGDAPPPRTPAAVCDEAALMTYIGEILFASSSQEKGLAWTRDAVDMAESTLLEVGEGDGRQRCAECLRVGLENWKTMVGRLVARAERAERESVEKAATAWFGSGRVRETEMERKRWEAERMIVDDRVRRLGPLVEAESGLEGIAPSSSLFV
ncbi:hypothetical protein BDV59DRAFT_14557 [Aspergillus ambiguus]|uniref:uncharacterized protein n=1 Tax=Aspergillus ambiguus TaxID=176160 RepID=UPI003CCC9241